MSNSSAGRALTNRHILRHIDRRNRFYTLNRWRGREICQKLAGLNIQFFLVWPGRKATLHKRKTRNLFAMALLQWWLYCITIDFKNELCIITYVQLLKINMHLVCTFCVLGDFTRILLCLAVNPHDEWSKHSTQIATALSETRIINFKLINMLTANFAVN